VGYNSFDYCLVIIKMKKKIKDTKKQKQPYTCPVCGGRGSVLGGFYGFGYASVSSALSETCRSCKGTGIVWGGNKNEK